MNFWIIITVVAVTIAVLSLIFVRKTKTEDGNYRAFLWLGEVFYEIIQSKIYNLVSNPANPGRAKAELKVQGGTDSNHAGGGWSVWRLGGTVFYLNFFVEPKPAIPLGVTQNQFSLENVETSENLAEKDESRDSHVPLGLDVIYKQRVVCPYLRQFNVQPDTNVDAEIKRTMEEIVRPWVYSRAEKEVQAGKGNGKEMWKDFTEPSRRPINLDCQPVFDEIRDQWGVEIIKNSIAVKDVRLPPHLQAAEQQKKQAELEAQANLGKQEIDAGAFAAQTAGREIAMISRLIGVPVKTLQAQIRRVIKADPEHGLESWLKKYPMVSRNWALIQQKELGVKPNLYGSASGGDLDSLMAILLALIGAAKGGGQTPPAGGGGHPGRDPSRQKLPEDMTPEEREDALRITRERDDATR